MIKQLFAAAVIFASAPAFAQQTYRPFTYTTQCALVTNTSEIYQYDNCKVIETREKNGALRTRNIFSNRFKLTIKSRFDKEKGFVTWDSHNKFEYKWDYKMNTEDRQTIGAWTYVMPGFMVEEVSWD